MVLLHSGGPGQYTVGAGYMLALAVREVGRPSAPKPCLRLILFHGKRNPAGAGAAAPTRLLPRPMKRGPAAVSGSAYGTLAPCYPGRCPWADAPRYAARSRSLSRRGHA